MIVALELDCGTLQLLLVQNGILLTVHQQTLLLEVESLSVIA